jgi:uncharacterized linocin/CFP29 family protein
MSDCCEPAFTDDQWSKIRQIVHDEALRARLAASFLPLYGPLPPATTTVPADSLSYPASGTGQRLMVDDDTMIRLASVAVNVFIKNHMLADPELVAATLMFTRAANIIARVEDAIIFRGKAASDVPGAVNVPPVYTITGAPNYPGLVDLASNKSSPVPIPAPTSSHPLGANIFMAVVEAINHLENSAYYKPYACVLSDDLFTAVYQPMPSSMVLPADSIPPLLNGPLLRSSTLKPGTGLVLSLQGNPVEIVVADDISVRYLQATEEGEHVFRVSQRFALRVKDNFAIALISRYAAPKK